MIKCFKNKRFENSINSNTKSNECYYIIRKYTRYFNNSLAIKNNKINKLIYKLINKIRVYHKVKLPNINITLTDSILGKAKNNKPLTGISFLKSGELHIILNKNINLEQDLIHEVLHYYVYVNKAELSFKQQEKLVCKLTKDFLKTGDIKID
ncbi:hypothetical protein [Lagierella sp.]|uniref:hypothetical protein n=1 Tax=Lagierella sp. TaxID=2849657 RepID=UPI0026202DB4|nr:hypothetical protein [Lagierella sp.]